MQNSLKFNPKSNMYKNSTGTVKLNMNTLEATSYDHWKFVTNSKIPNTLIFNKHKYSVTTSSHQRVVKLKLEQLGFDLVFVDQAESL